MTDEDDCPGEGRCHGCMSWCDRCGDVDLVCNASVCHVHRCYLCDAHLSRAEQDYNFETFNGWTKWCFSCHVKFDMETALRHGHNECEAGESAHRDIDQWMEQRGYHA